MNRLYFGDNLQWLSDRKEFPDGSIDLVYLDPPFNSNADYNVLFREPSGQVSQAQFHAFTDTWSWADAAETYHEFIDNCPNVAVVEMMEAFHSFLKHSPMMAYLAMMAPRLVELHRVLKETGSLYLHCDPTADHYLRMLLDGIFGAVNFRDEIIWKRRGIARLCEGAKFSLRKTHQFVIRASIAVIAASRTTGDGVEITLLVFVREYDPQLYEAFVTKKITAWALLMKLRELDPEF